MTGHTLEDISNKGSHYWEVARFDDSLASDILPRSFVLWIVIFYMFLYITRPWEQMFPWMGYLYFERIYAIFMIIAVVASRRARIGMAFQSAAILLFLCALGLSCLLAQDPSRAWVKFYPFLTIVVFYFILLKVVRSPYELIFVLISLISTMAIYLAKSLWEFFINGNHHSRQGVIRLIGIEDSFGGPNWLSVSVVLTLPILYFLWNSRHQLCLKWPGTLKKSFSRFLVFYFLLALTSIILTNSRGGMVTFLFFIATTTLKGGGIAKRFRYLLLASLFLTAVWLVMPEESKGRFMTMIDPSSGPKGAEDSAMGRIEGLKAGLSMFERLPVTGVGIGNFIPYREKNFDGIGLEAHSLIGQALGETGLIGSLTFVLMFSTTLVNTRRISALTMQQSDDLEAVLFRFAVAIRTIVYLLLLEGMFNHNLLRYNWIWVAAFAQLGLGFASAHYYAIKRSQIAIS